MGYKKELDKMVWSYSRVNSYYSCPFSWYKWYILGEPAEGNYWAENGLAMHETCQKVVDKEIPLEDAPGYYSDKYDEIESFTKDSVMDSCYESCMNFLSSTDFEFFNDQIIVGTELKLKFHIGRYKFVAYLDVLTKDKKTGKYIIWDYKSAKKFYKRDGSVLKSMQNTYDGYARQMYIYAQAVYENYGEYPAEMRWIHFRENGLVSPMKFSETDLSKTLEWVDQTIKQIYNDDEFVAKESFGMCNQLCSYRNNCEYKELRKEEESA
jgi:ATP-dependent helicase/DNAse subunit B